MEKKSDTELLGMIYDFEHGNGPLYSDIEIMACLLELKQLRAEKRMQLATTKQS